MNVQQPQFDYPPRIMGHVSFDDHPNVDLISIILWIFAIVLGIASGLVIVFLVSPFL